MYENIAYQDLSKFAPAGLRKLVREQPYSFGWHARLVYRVN